MRRLGGVGRGLVGSGGTLVAGLRRSSGGAGLPRSRKTLANCGNTKNNILRGPELVNLDMGLFRNFQVSERVNIQFRAEAFNVLNTTNLFIGEGSGIFNIGSTSFGRISPGSTYSPRIMQFAFRFEF